MAYDEGLAERLRDVLANQEVSEKKMFGGLSFMLHGNLLVGVIGDDLIARVGPKGFDDALKEPHTRAFDFTGKPMTNWVVVSPEGVDSDDGLQAWVDRALAFVSTLPPK